MVKCKMERLNYLERRVAGALITLFFVLVYYIGKGIYNYIYSQLENVFENTTLINSLSVSSSIIIVIGGLSIIGYTKNRIRKSKQRES